MDCIDCRADSVLSNSTALSLNGFAALQTIFPEPCAVKEEALIERARADTSERIYNFLVLPHAKSTVTFAKNCIYSCLMVGFVRRGYATVRKHERQMRR